ncbi:DgyrCDS9270 [Dimorphilus gyrociliatus]|uniref:DgyrCDS9270 n=1 Tax=Dimorphilus gyrociliatus TaxID=2664684 RepID=A0A7I8VWV1_9ANNE|nr:DgyrCDS9270 [Dimorphilus gyrociliatus]
MDSQCETCTYLIESFDKLIRKAESEMQQLDQSIASLQSKLDEFNEDPDLSEITSDSVDDPSETPFDIDNFDNLMKDFESMLEKLKEMRKILRTKRDQFFELKSSLVKRCEERAQTYSSENKHQEQREQEKDEEGKKKQTEGDYESTMDDIENEAEELYSCDSESEDKGATQYNGISSSDLLSTYEQDKADKLEKDSEESEECSSTSVTANGEQWNENNHSGSNVSSEWTLGYVLLGSHGPTHHPTNPFDDKYVPQIDYKSGDKNTENVPLKASLIEQSRKVFTQNDCRDLGTLDLLLTKDNYNDDPVWPSLKSLHHRSRKIFHPYTSRRSHKESNTSHQKSIDLEPFNNQIWKYFDIWFPNKNLKGFVLSKSVLTNV